MTKPKRYNPRKFITTADLHPVPKRKPKRQFKIGDIITTRLTYIFHNKLLTITSFKWKYNKWFYKLKFIGTDSDMNRTESAITLDDWTENLLIKISTRTPKKKIINLEYKDKIAALFLEHI